MRFLLGFLILSFGSIQAYIVSEKVVKVGRKEVVVLGDMHEPSPASGEHLEWLLSCSASCSPKTAILIEDREWQEWKRLNGDTLHDFSLHARKMKKGPHIVLADKRPRWMIWVASFAEDVLNAENPKKEAAAIEKVLFSNIGSPPSAKTYKENLKKALKELELRGRKYTNRELRTCISDLRYLETKLNTLLSSSNESISKVILKSKKRGKLLELFDKIDVRYADAWFMIQTLDAFEDYDTVVLFIGHGHSMPVCKAAQSELKAKKSVMRGLKVECTTELVDPIDLTKCAWMPKTSSLKLA